MSYSHSYPLEVTRALLECAKAARFNFGEDTALVAVQHMLRQTIDLFATIGAMGLNLKNIFALGKVYSNSNPVISTLRGMGVTVIETSVPEPGKFHEYFELDIARLWKVAAEAMATRGIKRVLVLDDAGVCITNVPPEVLHRYAICGVEQTSRGVFLFEEKPPPFAVISWARTAVKLEIGGSIFSQCFIDRLNNKFLGGQMPGELGIIGMGSIGKGLATLAVRQGNKVLYYDPDADLQIPDSLLGKTTRVDSLEELMVQCEYVVGCSGRNPFKDKWPLRYRPGIKLLSASGGDQEFGPIIKDLKEKSDFKVTPNTWDFASDHGPSGPLQIAYLGYPYNFVSRAPEAVPTEIVQLETGGLLAALVQARIYLQMCETSPERNGGMHRLSPRAQRFVFERWLRTMKERNVDIVELFGYDQAVLSAAQQDHWFTCNTEPHPSEQYTPIRQLEEMMERFICHGCGIKDLTQVGA
jgi:hypothetical protein